VRNKRYNDLEKNQETVSLASFMETYNKSVPESFPVASIKTLKQFSGRGGLQEGSTDEYFTPAFVAEGMWDLLEANGFQSGNVLEPSGGPGFSRRPKRRA